MRIISYNVNGIRAAIKKGFIEWLKTDPADIICLQETKATKDDVDVKEINALGYQDYWYSASSKKGYSGVAVFTKIKPDKVVTGNGHTQSDDEGRVIQLHFGKLLLINAYFPSGTSGQERQDFKMEWLNELLPWLNKEKKNCSESRQKTQEDIQTMEAVDILWSSAIKDGMNLWLLKEFITTTWSQSHRS